MHHSFNFKAFYLNLDFIFSNMILAAHLLILFANTSSYNSFVSKAKLNTIKTDLISYCKQLACTPLLDNIYPCPSENSPNNR